MRNVYRHFLRKLTRPNNMFILKKLHCFMNKKNSTIVQKVNLMDLKYIYKKNRYTYAVYNVFRSILASKHMFHFCTGHAQHNVYRMATGHKGFRSIQRCIDICPTRTRHSNRNQGYKRLQICAPHQTTYATEKDIQKKMYT